MLISGLRKLHGKVKFKKIFGFDTETANNNKDFVCASIVGDNYSKFFKNKKDMIKEILTNRNFRNSYLCATNLMFDFFALFGIKESIRDFKLIERGGNLVMATTCISYEKNNFKFYHPDKLRINLKENIKNSKERRKFKRNFYSITFIDSGNHLRTSVEKLGKIVDMPKMEKPSFLGNFPSNKDEFNYLKEYNIRDSTVTYQFMKFIQNQYNNIGCNMKVTIASTCLDLFRRKYLFSFWKQEDRNEIISLYKAYYGGRTEAFKRGLFSADNYGRIKVYDINSLYPFCLKNFNYPDVRSSYIVDKLTWDEIESFEGIGYFELISPKDQYIPFLPVKTDKLRFTTGKIKGYYDFYSIKRAVYNGYEVLKMKDGIVYPNRFSPFKNMIDDLYNLRKKFKERGDSSEIVAKILMNSFYGKFGYNFMNKEVLGDDEDIFLAADDKTIYPMGDSGIYRIVTGADSKIPSYVFPIIPLYVTSYARSVMHDIYKHTGVHKIFYTDTDCVFTTRKLKSSFDLGKLKLETTFNKLIIVKPKFYGGISEDGEKIKLKGAKSLKDFADFRSRFKDDNFSIDEKYFRKLRGGISSKSYVNEVYDIKKVMSLDDDKRKWERKHFSFKPQDSIPIHI